MHVGNPRRPQKKECEPCRVVREMLEGMEDEEEEGGGGEVDESVLGGSGGKEAAENGKSSV
jgi:hypothetical protein